MYANILAPNLLLRTLGLKIHRQFAIRLITQLVSKQLVLLSQSRRLLRGFKLKSYRKACAVCCVKQAESFTICHHPSLKKIVAARRPVETTSMASDNGSPQDLNWSLMHEVTISGFAASDCVEQLSAEFLDLWKSEVVCNPRCVPHPVTYWSRDWQIPCLRHYIKNIKKTLGMSTKIFNWHTFPRSQTLLSLASINAALMKQTWI